MSKIRVLIADDHAVLREGLASLINAQPDMEVVAQAADGHEAVSRAEETAPDVAIVDLTMPRCGGIAAIERIREISPKTRALVLTMYDDATHLRSVLAAGGVGYVVKRSAGKQLLTGIREVHAGRSFINVALAPGALKELIESNATPTPERRIPLSKRELEVLRLLAHGFTNRQIAERLEVSKKTIDTYRVRVADKLGLRSRAEMVRYALDTGLLGGKDDDASFEEPAE
jgi:two-component system response regulator NreC